MNMRTKYRILGVVVMVAVVAIVLPRLWEEASGTPDMKLSFAIPKQKTNDTATIQLPKQPEAPTASKGDFTIVGSDHDSANSNDPANSNDSANKIAATTDKPKQVASKAAAQITTSKQPVVKDATVVTPAAKPAKAHELFAQKVPDAWVIQLGTFANAANVKALIAKLRKDGLAAYQRKAVVGNRQLIQVFVGPEIEKTKLQPLLNELKNKFNLHGVVRRYKV